MAVDGPDAATAATLDDEALALRLKGHAFGTIAKTLGLGTSSDANHAFNRALRRRPAEARDEIRADENQRLDRLAVAVRENASLTEAESAKRLRTIDGLRTRLMAD